MKPTDTSTRTRRKMPLKLNRYRRNDEVNELQYIYTHVTAIEQIQSSVLRSVSGFTFKISLRESERKRKR